jgi:hypothetical protein
MAKACRTLDNYSYNAIDPIEVCLNKPLQFVFSETTGLNKNRGGTHSAPRAILESFAA